MRKRITSIVLAFSLILLVSIGIAHRSSRAKKRWGRQFRHTGHLRRGLWTGRDPGRSRRRHQHRDARTAEACMWRRRALRLGRPPGRVPVLRLGSDRVSTPDRWHRLWRGDRSRYGDPRELLPAAVLAETSRRGCRRSVRHGDVLGGRLDGWLRHRHGRSRLRRRGRQPGQSPPAWSNNPIRVEFTLYQSTTSRTFQDGTLLDGYTMTQLGGRLLDGKPPSVGGGERIEVWGIADQGGMGVKAPAELASVFTQNARLTIDKLDLERAPRHVRGRKPQGYPTGVIPDTFESGYDAYIESVEYDGLVGEERAKAASLQRSTRAVVLCYRVQLGCRTRSRRRGGTASP